MLIMVMMPMPGPARHRKNDEDLQGVPLASVL